MPLARAALEAIQQDSFADDLELPADALAWTPEEVRAFCESGGVQKPTAKLTSAPTKEFSAIKLFGDSHANTFISVEPAVPGADSPTIIAYPYTAGSAMGLHHCDSITGYREALIGDLRGTQPGEAVVLKFGQVDCDFVYYLKWVEDQSLAFEAFAAASVRKYFCFIDNALATLPVTREQLHIMSPFPTVVDDAALRESLCTLPFMSASFKRHFRAKLMTLKLPSLAVRTAQGLCYCERLQAEAAARGLRYLDVYTPLLGGHGVCDLANPDANHHLGRRHVPLLLQALGEAFGGNYVVARMPVQRPAPSLMAPRVAQGLSSAIRGDQGQPMAIKFNQCQSAPRNQGQSDPRVAQRPGGADEAARFLEWPPPNKEAPNQEAARLLEWHHLFGALRSGQIQLRLHTHAVRTYLQIEAILGAPIPMQLATPSRDAPGFATWLVRIQHQIQDQKLPHGPGDWVAQPSQAAHEHAETCTEDVRGPAADRSTRDEPPSIEMVRVLGRYRNYDDLHAWLVEGSTRGAADAMRALLLEAGQLAGHHNAQAVGASGAGPLFAVPPASFHAALSSELHSR